MHFDGVNDRIDIGNWKDWNLLLPFTIEANVYIESGVSTRTIMSSSNGNFSDSGMHLRITSDGELQLTLKGGVVGDILHVKTIDAIPTDSWQMLTVTYDRSMTAAGVNLYLEGLLMPAAILNDDLTVASTTTNSTFIGSRRDGSQLFTGMIDEVRIWDRVLCGAEIASRAGCQLSGTETNLEAYYNFNQGLAAGVNSDQLILFDGTGNEHNGNLMNFDLDGPTSNWVFGDLFSGICVEFVHGCMDSSACNYDSTAGCDDGSCVFPGCLDSMACNFDSTAGCDDGSCVFPGCLDSMACNFDSTAGCDDGSCVLPGCSDSMACNFDSSAGCDDGSCVFPGCLDSMACNFDSTAGCDDGSCVLPGCSDSMACNFDSTAGCDDGSCVFPDGCTDSMAMNFDSNSICDDGSCTYTPGEALHFEGLNDYVDLGNWHSWSTTEMFTVEAHVLLEQESDFSTILASSTSTYSESGFHLMILDSNRIRFTLKNGTGEVLQLDAPIPSITGVWAHLSVSYNGSLGHNGVRIYLNGNLLGYNVVLNSLSSNGGTTNPTHIGQHIDGDMKFNGIIDELRIWNRVLCDFEISEKMNCELVGNEQGLDAYFNFNIGSAFADNSGITTLSDLSGNGHDGTLIDFSLVGNTSNWVFGDSFTGSCAPFQVGCTNSTACNYDYTASCDDGSCFFPDGCTNELACNYDSTALCDDGSCILGPSNDVCENAIALVEGEFIDADNTGTCVDGTNPSCGGFNFKDIWYSYTSQYGGDITIYTNLNGSLDDSRLVLYDGCGGNEIACNDDYITEAAALIQIPTICGHTYYLRAGGRIGHTGTFEMILAEGDVSGCTDSLACNFDPCSNLDDGSCDFPDGCIDPSACNYDSLAVCDDGSCSHLGCMDALACNFDSCANFDDGSCILGPVNDVCEFAISLTEGLAIAADNSGTCVNGDDPSCGGINFKDIWYSYTSLRGGDITITTILNGTLEKSRLVVYGTCGGEELICNVIPGEGSPAIIEDMPTECGVTYFIRTGGRVGMIGTFELIVTEEDVTGCTNSLACNYNSCSNVDDGSCVMPDGCTNSTACNYDSNAICDDGSCTYFGCTDPSACNYDPTATCEDGSCSHIGCMDVMACNYDSCAILDDGSCILGPVNDVCEFAISLTEGLAIAADNSGSCVEGDDPSCGGVNFKDIWYSYTSLHGGDITITTILNGTLEKSRLVVYGSCGGNEIVCNVVFACNQLCNHCSLVGRLVCQPRGARDVADGIEPINAGAAVFICDHVGPVDFHAEGFETQIFDVADDADGRNHGVKVVLFDLAAHFDMGGDFALGAIKLFDHRFLHDLHALLFKSLLGKGADFFVFNRQHTVHNFDHSRVGAQRVVKAGKFDADCAQTR